MRVRRTLRGLLPLLPQPLCWLRAWLDGFWRMLGVDDALRRSLGPSRHDRSGTRLFALMANRAIDPRSTLSAAQLV